MKCRSEVRRIQDRYLLSTGLGFAAPLAKPAMFLPDRLTVAKWLVEQRRFSIIALEPRGKKPIAPWAAFRKAHPGPANLEQWFGQSGCDRNIGIVCGAISRLVMVDCDDDPSIAWADHHLPPTPMGTKTSKGQHRGYQHPGGIVRNKVRVNTGDAQLKIDIRADGGYVVAPTSIHESGVRYERLGEWPPVEELPLFDPSWIAEPDPTTAETEANRSASPGTDRARFLYRAAQYLAATPPAIEGDGGDTHTFQVCCRLVRGFDLSDAEALEVLLPWNARCHPPWSPAELTEKITNARLYGHEPVGGRRDRPQPNGSPFNLTDAGNAEYFASREGPDVRFDHSRQRWLLWDAPCWRPDRLAHITLRAKLAMRQRFADAALLDDSRLKLQLAKHATQSESQTRLTSLLTLAQSEPPISDAGDRWDANRDVLAVPNGVVELRTGQLRPGDRNDRITCLARVPYVPDAASARWTHALATIFVDPELRQFVQTSAGYSATGDTRRDCWFLAHGSGRNGKGTFLQPIGRVLGEYALELPSSLFDLRARYQTPYEKAQLPGKRFVTSSESGDTLHLNHDFIKQLTGGDPISARDIYARPFQFFPSAKLWLACNKKPTVTDDTAAFWARVFLIPFLTSFVDKEDRTLRPTLLEDPHDQAAILTWIVQGAMRYYEHGLEPPAIVQQATAEYRQDSDPLGPFLAEACDLEPMAVVLATELYDHYTDWTRRRNLPDRERWTLTKFGRLVGERFKKELEPDTRRAIYLGVARRPFSAS